ncbi:MAG TPA: Hpt domain-containing protein [Smithella sp.]|nr:Hpt domain-containing protein [Smithella sp.]
MLIDREKVHRELDIPEDLYDELLEMFIEQTEPALKTLEEIADHKNYEEIRKSAHLIHGSAGNLRITGIQSIAKEIEIESVEKQDIIIIKSNIGKLRAAFEEVKREVSGG